MGLELRHLLGVPTEASLTERNPVTLQVAPDQVDLLGGLLGGPSATAEIALPTVAMRADKTQFGASRRARWFGMPDETTASGAMVEAGQPTA